MVGRIDFDGFGGECLFIPSTPDVSGEEEDDGFLATFVIPKDGGNSGKQEERSASRNVYINELPCSLYTRLRKAFVYSGEQEKRELPRAQGISCRALDIIRGFAGLCIDVLRWG